MVRYTIDRMTMGDVPRVIEIERLAYPSTWPPSAYRKELQDNRWAHYIVLRDKQLLGEHQVAAQEARPRRSRLFPLSLLPSRPAVAVPLQDITGISEIILLQLIPIRCISIYCLELIL